MQLSAMYSCVCYHCEFLPLHIEILYQEPMFVLPQVLNQNIQKIKNSTTSNPKGSKRNMNHVDIRLMGLQKQKQSCEAGSDPRGHLWVTWGVYLCACKPPLADIILSHPPDLT